MAKASEMVKALEAALMQNIGVKAITVDGQSFTFNDRQSMLDELTFWQRLAARQSSKRKPFKGLNLGGGKSC